MARPTTPILSADKIARAALSLVDASGEFTIQEVAVRLGVRPSSLYNHVEGKSEIIEAMREIVFREETAVRDPTGSWDALPQIMRGYRDTFAQHPRLIPLLTSHTVMSAGVIEMYGVLATILRNSGIPDARVLDAITVMDTYVIGAALDLAAPELVFHPDASTSEAMQIAIDSAPRGRERADQSFELGLRIILDGIRALAE